MVDFTGRAAKAAAEILRPGEEVLAGTTVTATPFTVAGAGMTGGAIAAGALGVAVGMAWDRRRESRQAEADAVRPLPPVASRPPVEPPVPKSGALLAVTTERLLVWATNQLGKPRSLSHEVDLLEVDEVAWEEASAKWMGGRPPSILLWLGVGDRVLPVAAISSGAAGKHARAVIGALGERRPGRVAEFTP